MGIVKLIESGVFKFHLNKKGRRGWALSGDYLSYLAEGGNLSPEAWNNRVEELNREGVILF